MWRGVMAHWIECCLPHLSAASAPGITVACPVAMGGTLARCSMPLSRECVFAPGFSDGGGAGPDEEGGG